MNHWMSESVDAMGMCPVFFYPVGKGMGNSDVKAESNTEVA